MFQSDFPRKLWKVKPQYFKESLVSARVPSGGSVCCTCYVLPPTEFHCSWHETPGAKDRYFCVLYASTREKFLSCNTGADESGCCILQNCWICPRWNTSERGKALFDLERSGTTNCNKHQTTYSVCAVFYITQKVLHIKNLTTKWRWLKKFKFVLSMNSRSDLTENLRTHCGCHLSVTSWPRPKAFPASSSISL